MLLEPGKGEMTADILPLAFGKVTGNIYDDVGMSVGRGYAAVCLKQQAEKEHPPRMKRIGALRRTCSCCRQIPLPLWGREVQRIAAGV
jgi:hypothetical protein